MISNFDSALTAALTPVALMSGKGMMPVAMTSRHAHATNRIRELLAERAGAEAVIDPQLESSIEPIYRRAWYLRRGMLAVTLSATLSALIVMPNVIEAVAGLPPVYLKTQLLLGGMGLLVVSAVCFVMEIRIPLHALALSVHPLGRFGPLAEGEKP